MKKLCATIVIALISIHSFAQAPNWAWAKSAGGTTGNVGYSIAIDAAGNTYITGSFGDSTITFGTTTLTNSGADDIFIAKYDANGNIVWAKSLGGTDYDYGGGIALDTAGNTYITGSFNSPSMPFGTTTLTNNGSDDIFIAKYDTNGNALWATTAGGVASDRGNSIKTDAAGNTYITGQFYSPTITFGTTTLTNNGNYDVFIAKYDANGNVVWAKSVGGTSDDFGRSISVDASGNSYITGGFSGPTITFGATTFTNLGNEDIFIAKYDANGNVLWAKSAGGTSIDFGYGIALDAIGNTYITGYFQSPTITFGVNTLTNNGSTNILIVKYDTNGNIVWAKSAGGNDSDIGNSIATDAAGNTTITGYFGSPTITFGATTLANNGGGDIYIAKFDTNGNVLWAKSAGGNNYDAAYSIAIDAVGNAYLTGHFQSPAITFGATTLTNNSDGYSNVFIAKLDGTTGIAEMEKGETVLLAPNPFTSQLSISFNEAQKNTSIKLMNTLGECIQQLTTSNQQLILDMSSFARGMYFVQITDANKNVVNKKVIKE